MIDEYMPKATDFINAIKSLLHKDNTLSVL